MLKSNLFHFLSSFEQSDFQGSDRNWQSVNAIFDEQSFDKATPSHHLLSNICFASVHHYWEGVATSNFTTITGYFFHYIKIVFLVHHYYYNQNIKSVFLVHHYYNKNQTFGVFYFTYGVKKDHNVKNQKYFFKQLPMAYYLCIPRPVGG